jgi:hypothetical protein
MMRTRRNMTSMTVSISSLSGEDKLCDRDATLPVAVILLRGRKREREGERYCCGERLGRRERERERTKGEIKKRREREKRGERAREKREEREDERGREKETEFNLVVVGT